MKIDIKGFTAGVLAAIIPSTAAAWAFAMVAANYVLQPHLARARERVHLMCIWISTTDDNQKQICEATGAKCAFLDKKVIMSKCEEVMKEGER